MPPSTGFELRASWCPADGGSGDAGDGGDLGGDADELAAEIGGAVAAWCELLASAAGLPATGTVAIGGRAPSAPGGAAAPVAAPWPAGGDADDGGERGIRGADAGAGRFGGVTLDDAAVDGEATAGDAASDEAADGEAAATRSRSGRSSTCSSRATGCRR